MSQISSSFDHFQFETLAAGVHAAIATPGGVARSNAGIIDLGDRILLFDMSLSPRSARDLIAAAQRLIGRPIAAAINSHWHQDHVLGNQALPLSIPVISTSLTRDLVVERVPQWIADRRESYPQMILERRAQLDTERDIMKREQLEQEIRFFETMVSDLPDLVLRPPDQTFEDRLVFKGPTRTAELITFGGGHTASDSILVLPADGIAFVGDLLFNGLHPWLGDGSPDEWLRIYALIEALTPPIEVVVPGHGQIGTLTDFAALRRYLKVLTQLVDDVIASGGTAEDAAVRPVPAAFIDWPGQDMFAANVRFLYAHRSG